ncbi:unnamed protein product [Arabidopsis thaliana]|uniref:(thale cress) hypothetical protein n=1 Tax=Arabidopsis thaliana TaxID=3702 RepID=A0A7G2F2Q3_ARATH|nr:unnamed protein product [Arabidopsis thaliana]
MSGTVKDIVSKEELDNLRHSGAPLVLHFWASWCDASKQMDQVFSHLATDFPRAHFFRVEAEEHPEISEAYSVALVPYFVFFKDGKTVDTLEGADPSSLANKVGKVAGSITPASLGLAAGPTILETVKKNAKASGQDRAQPVSTADALKNLGILVDIYQVATWSKHVAKVDLLLLFEEHVLCLVVEGIMFIWEEHKPTGKFTPSSIVNPDT